ARLGTVSSVPRFSQVCGTGREPRGQTELSARRRATRCLIEGGCAPWDSFVCPQVFAGFRDGAKTTGTDGTVRAAPGNTLFDRRWVRALGQFRLSPGFRRFPGRGENHGDRRNCPRGAGQHTVYSNVAARLGTVSSVPGFSRPASLPDRDRRAV